MNEIPIYSFELLISINAFSDPLYFPFIFYDIDLQAASLINHQCYSNRSHSHSHPKWKMKVNES